MENNAGKRSKKPALFWTDRVYLAYLRDIAFWIVGVILAYSLLFRVVTVSGPSMNTTLVHGDCLVLLGNMLAGEPEHGDIIVANGNADQRAHLRIKQICARKQFYTY